MISSLLLSGSLTLAVYLVLMWRLSYDKVYYLGIVLLIAVFITFFAFDRKIASAWYGIEDSSVPVEQRDQVAEKTLPVRRLIGFSTFWFTLVTFILSVANLIGLGRKYEISSWLSVPFGVVTLVILVAGLFFVGIYSNRII